MTKKILEAVMPYERPQCGVLIIHTEQIICASGDIDDFERVEDDWN